MSIPVIQWFREATPYIRRHKHRVFVIALSGEILQQAHFRRLICDIAILSTLGVRLVLVHGIRPQINHRLHARGVKPAYHQGLRITDEASLNIVKEAVGYTRLDVEYQLSAALTQPYADAVSESVAPSVVSGNFITARPLGIIDGVDYQHTGKVRRINRDFIQQQLTQNNIVLLSPLGFSPSGQAWNLRYEEVATFTAGQLKADKLIFITHKDFTLPKQLSLQDTKTYLEAQTRQEIANTPNPLSITPQHPDINTLLYDALEAATKGVVRTHLIPHHLDGGLLQELYTRDGIGTMIAADQYDDIRPAQSDDISGILALIEPLERKGILIKRSREQLELEIESFVVLERDHNIIGCAALYPYLDHIDDNGLEHYIGELACLAVNQSYKGQQQGDRLLMYIEQHAKKQQLAHLLVLTTQTSDWFQERGFIETSVEHLPAKKKALYNYQRNSKVLFKAL